MNSMIASWALQTAARFAHDHQLVDPPHRWWAGGFPRCCARRRDRPWPARVASTKQRAGDVHQDRVARLAAALGQGVDDVNWSDDLARLAEAEYRQGIGDLLEQRQEGVQFRGWPRSLRTNRSRLSLDPHSSSHNAPTTEPSRRGRVRQAGALGVHRLVVEQRLVEAVLFLQCADSRRLRGALATRTAGSSPARPARPGSGRRRPARPGA